VLPRIALSVLAPSQYSRLGSSAARKILSATASGCTTGGTGRGRRGIWVRAQSNCGVFTAGSSTMVTAIAL
jgi:hypothetical protein